MSSYSIYWVPLILITMGICLWFIYLYLKEKDKRKLMFALAFFTSVISFVYLTLGYHNYYTSILSQNIFNWMSMPIMFAILIAVNESLFKPKKFDSAFNLFIGLFIICFIILVIPLNLWFFTTILRIIITFEIVIVSGYFLFKNKDISNLLFLISMLCFSIASIVLTRGHEDLSIFGFFMANTFIALVFVIPYTVNENEWEVAILKDGNICYTTDITDDVLGNQTEENVSEVMLKLQKMEE